MESSGRGGPVGHDVDEGMDGRGEAVASDPTPMTGLVPAHLPQRGSSPRADADATIPSTHNPHSATAHSFQPLLRSRRRRPGPLRRSPRLSPPSPPCIGFEPDYPIGELVHCERGERVGANGSACLVYEHAGVTQPRMQLREGDIRTLIMPARNVVGIRSSRGRQRLPPASRGRAIG